MNDYKSWQYMLKHAETLAESALPANTNQRLQEIFQQFRSDLQGAGLNPAVLDSSGGNNEVHELWKQIEANVRGTLSALIRAVDEYRRSVPPDVRARAQNQSDRDIEANFGSDERQIAAEREQERQQAAERQRQEDERRRQEEEQRRREEERQRQSADPTRVTIPPYPYGIYTGDDLVKYFVWVLDHGVTPQNLESWTVPDSVRQTVQRIYPNMQRPDGEVTRLIRIAAGKFAARKRQQQAEEERAAQNRARRERRQARNQPGPTGPRLWPGPNP